MMQKWLTSVFMFFVLLNPSFGTSLKVEQILGRLAKQSGLEHVKGLNLRFADPTRLEEQYLRDLWHRHPEQTLRQESRLLKLMGIFREEIDLGRQLERLVKGNIKAYYQRDGRILYIDQTLSFEDEFSLGPVVAESWALLTDSLSADRNAPGPFFSDSNWNVMLREVGEATFVMHRFFEEDLDLYTGPEGVMSTTRNPLVSMATGYDLEPIFGAFFTQSLTLGAQVTEEAFRKKEWKGLVAHLTKEDRSLGEILKDRTVKENHGYRPLAAPQLEGFILSEERMLGIFLGAYVLKRSPQEVWNGFGAMGDVCGIYKDESGGGHLLRWESEWRSSEAARDVYLILRDKFESDLACRFELGSRRDGPFLAGRDDTGAYVFLFQGQRRTVLVRSYDRLSINRFIANGSFMGQGT